MDKIQIRAGCITDSQRLSEIAQLAYAKYVPLMGKKPAPMLSCYKTHLREDVVFVAVKRSTKTLLGFAIICIKHQEYWLENIAVDPHVSGQGIGRQLLATSEQYISKFTQHYHLFTNVIMTENIRWYKRLGFKEIKRSNEEGYERVYFKKHVYSTSKIK